MSKEINIGDTLAIRIRRIANGYLVHEEKRDDDYKSAVTEELFFPTFGAIEREILIRLRIAAGLVVVDSGPDF